jgi:hypothetical protein
MLRRRFKQIVSLDQRLSEEAARLRSHAKQIPPGPERNDLIRRARQTEAAVHINRWLTSPRFKQPT